MKKKSNRPPVIAKKLLLVMRRYLQEYSSAGDLLEEFREITARKNRRIAVLWYWGQFFLLCRHIFIPMFIMEE